MKRLIPDPPGSADHLKESEETGLGYQAVSVELKDGRRFDQAVASEGCIIQVRGYQDVPFAADDVASVFVHHTPWNFRESSDSRRPRQKSKAASA